VLKYVLRNETSEGKEGDEESQTEEEVRSKYCYALLVYLGFSQSLFFT